MLNIEEIKAREQAATPGPWAYSEEQGGYFHNNRIVLLYGTSTDEEDAKLFLKKEDADFIAHARTDIPSLLVEVERLTEQHECDVHNVEAMQATLNQQAKNCEKLLSDDKRKIATLKKALKTAIHRASPDSTSDAVNAIAANLIEETQDQLAHETHGESEENP